MGYTGTVIIALSFTAMTPVVAREMADQPSPRNTPVVGLIDEVQELFPDTRLDRPVKNLIVHTARNTLASVHVLVTGLQGTETIAFAESDAAGTPTPGARWYQLIDVPVLEKHRTRPKIPRHTAGWKILCHCRAPFRVYDHSNRGLSISG
jgi:hypothetical protein